MLALASLFGFDWKTPPIEAPRSPREVSAGRGRGKRKTIIGVQLKRGLLTQFGYHADKSPRARHMALMKAVDHEGYVGVIRHLNLVATYSKNRTPHYSRIFRQDQRWLSDKYRKEKEHSTRATRGSSSKLTAGASPSRGGSSGMGRYMDDDDEDTDEDASGQDRDDEEEEEDMGEEMMNQDGDDMEEPEDEDTGVTEVNEDDDY